MIKKYVSNLSVIGIRKLCRNLEDYKRDLPNKVARALDILADKGITVAKDVSAGSGTFGKCVEFEKTVPQIKGNEVSAIMRGIDLGAIMSWQQADGTTKSATVNALLMLEFGSGKYADEEHRGTFPDSTHSFDTEGWYFKPVGSNQWVHSFGYKPKQPMLKAFEEMEEEIENAFDEAFRF